MWGPLSTTTCGVGLTSTNNTCWDRNFIWVWGILSNHYPWGGLTSKKHNHTCWDRNFSLTNRLHFLPFAHRCSGNGNSHARPLCPAHLLPGFCFFWVGFLTTGRFWDAPLNDVSGRPSRVATTSFHKGSKAWVGHIDVTKWWHGFAWSKRSCATLGIHRPHILFKNAGQVQHTWTRYHNNHVVDLNWLEKMI